MISHAKWQKTEQGHRLYEAPFPDQEPRRIYTEWQWSDNGQE